MLNLPSRRFTHACDTRLPQPHSSFSPFLSGVDAPGFAPSPQCDRMSEDGGETALRPVLLTDRVEGLGIDAGRAALTVCVRSAQRFAHKRDTTAECGPTVPNPQHAIRCGSGATRPQACASGPFPFVVDTPASPTLARASPPAHPVRAGLRGHVGLAVFSTGRGRADEHIPACARCASSRSR